MARWEPEQTVTQSVLERLIDREPGAASEAAADARAIGAAAEGFACGAIWSGC